MRFAHAQCAGRRRSTAALFAFIAVNLVLWFSSDVGAVAATSPPGQVDTLGIAAQPSLYPAFDTSVSDYVARCVNGSPVKVSVRAPPGTLVSVAGTAARSGSFSVDVRRSTGQDFTISQQESKHSPSTYFVRCLPTDFPQWSSTHAGQRQAEWYLVAPLQNGAGPAMYLAIFDDNGVPVWWRSLGGHRGVFTTLLSNGDIAFTHSGGADELRLDGSFVRTFGPAGVKPDSHEFLLLPDGHYLMAGYKVLDGIDLSSWGGPSSASVLDEVIEELASDGTLVWSWDPADHIPVSETGARWQALAMQSAPPYDAYHFNSIEVDGDSLILSFRHLNAIYKVNRTTGNIVWKLGGSERPESLAIAGDPVFDAGGGFSGQHDGRVLPDGSVTLHDNATGLSRPPRAVRYAIDTATHVATLMEQVTDPAAPKSGCCGSARRLPGGDWVMSWGGGPLVTELTQSGERVFALSMPGFFSYRATPVPFGILSREALRAAMNAQFPT